MVTMQPGFVIRFGRICGAVASLVLATIVSGAQAQEDSPELVAVSARAVASDRVVVTYAIAPGIQLYRDQVRLEAADDDVKVLRVDLPPGWVHVDPVLEKTVSTYSGVVRVVLHVRLRGEGGILRSTVQGCDPQIGVCYPAVSQRVPVVF